jgi:plasmid stabilization system protein ParE
MSRRVVLRLEADLEFGDVSEWYERQRPGLGADFIACVEETLNRIAETPELHGKTLGEVRRAGVRRFPYSVYYAVEADQIVVLAVQHGNRDPSAWQSRIQKN